LEDSGTVGIMILKCSQKKLDERGGLNESRSGYGEVLGCCECSIELWVLSNAGNFLNR